jgi:hypothetical protein
MLHIAKTTEPASKRADCNYCCYSNYTYGFSFLLPPIHGIGYANTSSEVVLRVMEGGAGAWGQGNKSPIMSP